MHTTTVLYLCVAFLSSTGAPLQLESLMFVSVSKLYKKLIRKIRIRWRKKVMNLWTTSFKISSMKSNAVTPIFISFALVYAKTSQSRSLAQSEHAHKPWSCAFDYIITAWFLVDSPERRPTIGGLWVELECKIEDPTTLNVANFARQCADIWWSAVLSNLPNAKFPGLQSMRCKLQGHLFHLHQNQRYQARRAASKGFAWFSQSCSKLEVKTRTSPFK